MAKEKTTIPAIIDDKKTRLFISISLREDFNNILKYISTSVNHSTQHEEDRPVRKGGKKMLAWVNTPLKRRDRNGKVA
jgi:hypothetical protein